MSGSSVEAKPSAPAPHIILLRRFQPGDEVAFRTLNEQWIAIYFTLEDKDRVTLNDPAGKILSHGGHIFMAERDGSCIGTCALLAIELGAYEVGKMAVEEQSNGLGVGRLILERAISEAKKLSAHRLYLETNSQLLNAGHHYESIGFQHRPPERVTPSPYARSNVLMEMLL